MWVQGRTSIHAELRNNAPGRRETQITQENITCPTYPCLEMWKWAPDSSRIAYMVNTDHDFGAINKSDLYSVRPDGTERVRLAIPVSGPRAVKSFAWSPPK